MSFLPFTSNSKFTDSKNTNSKCTNSKFTNSKITNTNFTKDTYSKTNNTQRNLFLLKHLRLRKLNGSSEIFTNIYVLINQFQRYQNITKQIPDVTKLVC